MEHEFADRGMFEVVRNDEERQVPLIADELRRDIQAAMSRRRKPLQVPGFEGVARRSRRPNEDGVWGASAPYIVIRCGKLNGVQRTELQKVIDAYVPHEPEVIEPTITSEERKAFRAMLARG